MKRRALAIIALACLIAPAARTQESGYWRAASNTASSITGDIILSAERLTINFTNYTVTRMRALKPEEISGVFDLEPEIVSHAGLYRMNIPGDKRFLHKNTLCGSEDVQWMVAYATGHELRVAFFSNAKIPSFKREDIMNSTDLCGTFTYAR